MSEEKIIEIDDARPHLVIQGLKSVHVIPLVALQKITSGTLKLSEVHGFDDWCPSIINEWMHTNNYR